MANTTAQLNNVNLLTKSQYDAISAPSADELYAVETPTVVETYSDDDGNWYRIYSDGWVIQGGKYGAAYSSYQEKNFPFLKAFADLNYFAWAENGHTVSLGDSTTIKEKTTTSVTFAGTYNSNGLGNWCAFGQGE